MGDSAAGVADGVGVGGRAPGGTVVPTAVPVLGRVSDEPTRTESGLAAAAVGSSLENRPGQSHYRCCDPPCDAAVAAAECVPLPRCLFLGCWSPVLRHSTVCVDC